MPINLSKAKGTIEKYRVAHTLLHESPVARLSEAHNPLTETMRDALQRWGFNHEDDVFDYSDNDALISMGYSSKEEFYSTVYDISGNVKSGKESDHNTWEARFK